MQLNSEEMKVLERGTKCSNHPETEGTWYFPECTIVLCSKCKKTHRELKKDHEIALLKEEAPDLLNQLKEGITPTPGNGKVTAEYEKRVMESMANIVVRLKEIMRECERDILRTLAQFKKTHHVQLPEELAKNRENSIKEL